MFVHEYRLVVLSEKPVPAGDDGAIYRSVPHALSIAWVRCVADDGRVIYENKGA